MNRIFKYTDFANSRREAQRPQTPTQTQHKKKVNDSGLILSFVIIDGFRGVYFNLVGVYASRRGATL